MKIVVTGGAGFIGSNLVDSLVAAGHEVMVVDNFSTGQRRFLDETPFRGQVVELDIVDEPERLRDVVEGHDAVVHLAANADVRFGWRHPRRDLEQNLIGTVNVAEAMRSTGVDRLIFSSTGSVYGDAGVIPTPEDAPFPIQTSLYGASKAAAEGFLAAYAEASHLTVSVFRFVSIMGPRYTHGHVRDFMYRLRDDPTRLEILGDGSQRKSYLDVSDCVAAIIRLLEPNSRFDLFNLGGDGFCTVVESARWICERLGLEPAFAFGEGDRGWVGDNPFIWLDTARMRATGWTPRISIRQAVERSVDYIAANPWVLDLGGAP